MPIWRNPTKSCTTSPGCCRCRLGPAGSVAELSTAEWILFKHNPYPEVAKGLAEYWMAPENLRVMIEEGDGRWGPPYKGMYDSDFWKRPVFQHWRVMLERGRQFAVPWTMNAARRGARHLRYLAA